MPSINEFGLFYPYALLLLGIYAFCEWRCRGEKRALYFSNLPLLKEIGGSHKNVVQILKHLMVICLVLALADPITQKHTVNKNAQGYEMLLALDASDSMKENDRFGIAKKIVADFIDKREHDRLALSVFASFSYIVVPFTYDKQPLKDILHYLELGVAGMEKTALYEALYQSGRVFENSGAKHKILILLTDGLDTKKNMDLDVAIAHAKNAALKVYTIAVGEKDDYNGDVLRQIAQETGGTFFETNDPRALQGIYEAINQLEKSVIETTPRTHTTHYFQTPLLFSLLLLLLLMWIRRGVV